MTGSTLNVRNSRFVGRCGFVSLDLIRNNPGVAKTAHKTAVTIFIRVLISEPYFKPGPMASELSAGLEHPDGDGHAQPGQQGGRQLEPVVGVELQFRQQIAAGDAEE